MKEKIKILDLGCGTKKYKNNPWDEVIGVDINQNSQADVIHDLNKFPYPFEDNTFDMIWAHHVLEHLTDTIRVMRELHRICKSNAIIKINVPHFSSVGAWCYIGHVKAFGLEGFRRHIREFGFEPIRVELSYSDVIDTKPKKLVNAIINRLANWNTHLCERIWCHWIGGFATIRAELKVIK